MTRKAKWLTGGSVILVVVFVLAGVWFFMLRLPADRRAFAPIGMEWNRIGPNAEPETQTRLAERCLDLHRQYPGTIGGVSSLLLAATNAKDTAAGQEANRLFMQQIAQADPRILAAAFDRVFMAWGANSQFAPPLLDRVRGTPKHPSCGRLLAKCCSLTRPDGDGTPSELYREAADLIAERYAASPDIYHFCEGLADGSGSPPWATEFEPHLRAILDVNRDRAVRCAAQYALASVVMVAGENRQEEAAELFRTFYTEFDGTQPYDYQNIEQGLRGVAEAQLKELKFRSVGNLAPEIAGIDLAGRPLKLSDYRGRVVLLNFWGTWCFPCMKLVPHERELAAAHRERPFDIVGVDCDDDVQKAREAVAQHGMTWRSFRNQAGEGPAITAEWKVLGFPTLYLIDHHGIIRKRWIGSPSDEELDRTVNVLVDAAERGIPADAMKPVAKVLAAGPPAALPAPASPDSVAAPRPGKGFIDKVYHAADGTEAKYAVFVPPTYDGNELVPTILYLHGSGARGTDGRAQLEHGLAEAIRAKSLDFPFLVIFPQAREGEEWMADTAGGRRALAILDQVQADYRVDPDRIALTGVSMGGAGTWSLAAADPHRWSAIVPICHGGDTASAAKLVGVPCWCFHGAADRMIPPQQSRDMVEAILNAGGRPLYQELPGVGHNDCAARVYGMNDLYEWLQTQSHSDR